jgi:hypothetical protein
MDQSAFRKRLYAIVAGGACGLMILVWIFIKGGLSPRGFGMAVLILWIAMFAAAFSLIRSRQRSAEDIRRKQIASGVPAEALDRERCVRSIRSLKRLIAMFATFLGYGLLATWDEPLLPRAAGAAVDVFFLAAFVRVLIRSQKTLKGFQQIVQQGNQTTDWMAFHKPHPENTTSAPPKRPEQTGSRSALVKQLPDTHANRRELMAFPEIRQTADSGSHRLV